MAYNQVTGPINAAANAVVQGLDAVTITTGGGAGVQAAGHAFVSSFGPESQKGVRTAL